MEDFDFYGKESTGTTTLSLVYDEGVVVAADSRTTTGVYIPSRVTDKLDPIHHRIFCLRAGRSAHTQNIAKYVRYYLD
jgi:20S proteasome subunit beta 1